MGLKSLKVKKSTYDLLKLAKARVLHENPSGKSSFDYVLKKVLDYYLKIGRKQI